MKENVHITDISYFKPSDAGYVNMREGVNLDKVLVDNTLELQLEKSRCKMM